MKTIKSLALIFSLISAISISARAQTVLTTLDGNKIDVEAQSGKVVILAIGASWLPLSAKQAEYTNMLAKSYAGKDVVVYFIATDSTSAKSRNFASNDEIRKFGTTNKLTVPVLRDSDGTLTLKKFNVDQLPSFVILNKNGDSASTPFGGIDPKYDITVPISKTVNKLL